MEGISYPSLSTWGARATTTARVTTRRLLGMTKARTIKAQIPMWITMLKFSISRQFTLRSSNSQRWCLWRQELPWQKWTSSRRWWGNHRCLSLLSHRSNSLRQMSIIGRYSCPRSTMLKRTWAITRCNTTRLSSLQSQQSCPRSRTKDKT